MVSPAIGPRTSFSQSKGSSFCVCSHGFARKLPAVRGDVTGRCVEGQQCAADGLRFRMIKNA